MVSNGQKFGCFCQFLSIALAFTQFTDHAFGKKTNQAVYEEPFDIAAGGAALTRASQEGVMFANPALMPYGEKAFRWFGSEFALLATKNSYNELQSLTGRKKGPSKEGQEAEDDNRNYFDQVFDNPLHFGATSTISLITNNFGIGTFARFEPDIAGQRHNETGIPEFRARAEGYTGMVASAAGRLTNWLSLGVTGKYLYKVEPDIIIDLADVNKVQEIRNDPSSIRDQVTAGQGTSLDAGALVFLQGQKVDYRLAMKIDDIGDTQFSEDQRPFRQAYHAGIGLTFHNAVDSLHLSLDFRDITGVYQEPLPLRIYAGAKVIFRNFIGLAAGLYQGYPTFGVRLDLMLVKLGFSVYGRELGEYLGDAPRTIYLAYLGFGI